ncbi:MAG: SGNH/GDSL hydrolase family protein [Clostridia bacterium]|nr:SGNH/GDSL hydrolase family protein [Clostridia bacterium]
MKKIKIYGDSILKGVTYNEELKRYKLCGYRFDELSQNGIDVENNSKMGATIDKGFEILKATLDDCDENTVVVMEYGGNDCNFNWSDVSDDPNGSFECATPEERFTETYLEAIKYARSKGAKVAVCTLVPIDSERFMNWVSRGLNYNNILDWLGDVNMIARWQEYYSRLSEKVAQLADCPILDLRSIFLKNRELRNMIGEDGMHPSPEGHKLIRDTFQSLFLNTSSLASAT